MGSILTPEEEALRTKLQNMQAVVSAPTQFKGRLSELLSQIRMQRNQFANNSIAEYAIDKNAEDEMKTILTMQQRAMEVLKETVNKDLEALDIIIKGLPELQQTWSPLLRLVPKLYSYLSNIRVNEKKYVIVTIYICYPFSGPANTSCNFELALLRHGSTKKIQHIFM